MLPRPVIFKKIEETLALGGTAILMQGGHNPDLGIDWYEDLFREIKARYPIHLHALSPSEIQHVARKARLTSSEALARLRDAGLDSLPGGGAEMLVDRVRKIISPKKTTSDEWLAIMRAAHRLGMSTTATMMWGHVETLEERIEHLRRIRDLQDEMHGFRAFISWTYQPDNTALAPQVTWNPTSFDYLLMQAVTRIYLDNVEHIQSSWVTQGTKIGQVALALRSRRHGVDHDRGERGLGGRHDLPRDDRGLRALHPKRRVPPPAARHALPHSSRVRGGVKVTVSTTCAALPEVVWEWIADPHKHIRMLPDEIRNAEVLENGDIACELVTVGVREPMTVRVVEADPPRRLVEARVDGKRKGTSIFEIEPEGEHASRVTLTAEVALPMLASAIASGPMKSALGDQLRNLATLVATEG